MKERENIDHGFPPNNLTTQNLSKNDFLSPQDIQNNPVINNPIHNPNVLNSFPDLHGDDNRIPSIREKDKISKDITEEISKLSKSTLIEENIQRDIESVSNKFKEAPKDPKNTLKDLIAKGEHREDFQLYGHTWTMRALDQNDLLLSIEDANIYTTSNTGQATAIMFSQVVHSLEAIDGIPLYKWFPDIKLENFNNNQQQFILACKIALRQYMSALPPIVIDDLYYKYTEIDERRNKAIEDLKNS